MTTSIPKHRNRYRIAEARQQMADKLGGDKIELETNAGNVIEMEHPMFRSKETRQALKPLADDDSEGIARVCLGDKGLETWLADGHDTDELGFVFAAIQADAEDYLAGRRRPTRS